MQKYDEMVDSGVVVIGKIPTSWSKSKLKYITQSMVSGATPTSTDETLWSFDEGVPWVNIADITDLRGVTTTKKRLTDKGIASKNMSIQPAGSILFSIFASLGKMGRLEIDAVTNQAIVAITPNIERVNNQYIFYYLSFIRDYLKYYASSNTQDNINETKLKSLDVILPNIETQQKIADFLDTETAKIDDLIARQERLLELLEEKRRATITHAVTRGLNPNVELKETNIPWLGRIPAHWSTEKIKYVAKRRDEKISTASGHKYIGLEHVESFTGKEISAEAQSEPEGLSLSYREGDVLFGKLRPYLTKVIKTTDNGICSSEFIVLNAENKILPEFLKYSLLNNRFIEEINSSTYGAKMPRANWDYIGNTYLPIPSVEEQQKITDFISQQEQAAIKLKQKIQTQITLLRERRTSLISHAVTGKIKV